MDLILRVETSTPGVERVGVAACERRQRGSETSGQDQPTLGRSQPRTGPGKDSCGHLDPVESSSVCIDPEEAGAASAGYVR